MPQIQYLGQVPAQQDPMAEALGSFSSGMNQTMTNMLQWKMMAEQEKEKTARTLYEFWLTADDNGRAYLNRAVMNSPEMLSQLVKIGLYDPDQGSFVGQYQQPQYMQAGDSILQVPGRGENQFKPVYAPPTKPETMDITNKAGDVVRLYPGQEEAYSPTPSVVQTRTKQQTLYKEAPPSAEPEQPLYTEVTLSDGTTAAIFAPGTNVKILGEKTASKPDFVSAPATTQYIIWYDEQGKQHKDPNPNYNPALPTEPGGGTDKRSTIYNTAVDNADRSAKVRAGMAPYGTEYTGEQGELYNQYYIEELRTQLENMNRFLPAGEQFDIEGIIASEQKAKGLGGDVAVKEKPNSPPTPYPWIMQPFAEANQEIQNISTNANALGLKTDKFSMTPEALQVETSIVQDLVSTYGISSSKAQEIVDKALGRGKPNAY